MAGTVKADRVRFVTASVGTGAIVPGAAVNDRYLTPTEWPVPDGAEVILLIEQGTDYQEVRCTYTASPESLSRDTTIKSKIGGVAGAADLNLGGNAICTVVPSGTEMTASEIAFTAAGDIAAATVQAAIEELDAEKIATAAKATQANMEAETADKYPDAAILKHHPGIAKAWCYAPISGGVPSIGGSFNISGLSDNADSLITFLIGNDFSSENWAGVAMIYGNASQAFARGHTKNAGAYAVASMKHDGTGIEPSNGWEFIAFGDQ